EITLNHPDRIASALYHYLERTSSGVKADKDGRFTLSGAVPGVKFYLQTRKGETYFVGEPKIGLREVEPGKTLDLGDWKLKPQWLRFSFLPRNSRGEGVLFYGSRGTASKGYPLVIGGREANRFGCNRSGRAATTGYTVGAGRLPLPGRDRHQR